MRLYGREAPPQITHVESKEECLSLLTNQRFDLVIIFDKLDDVDSYLFGNTNEIIDQHPDCALREQYSRAYKNSREKHRKYFE